jgi:CBS domain-containing protein
MKAKNADEIMTRPAVTISPDASLTDAIELMLNNGISGMPVVDADGRLVGIITEKDVMNFAFSGNADDTAVREAMTTDVVTYPPKTDIAVLTNCLGSKHFRRVPIVSEGKVIGIVTRRDIMREILSVYSK